MDRVPYEYKTTPVANSTHHQKTAAFVKLLILLITKKLAYRKNLLQVHVIPIIPMNSILAFVVVEVLDLTLETYYLKEES